jgi:hypothetical protein
MIADGAARMAELQGPVYDETQMRRGFSIFLILFFGLGPLSAMIVDGGGEASLPLCCRRHGAHHCAMSVAAMKAQAEPGATPVLAVPVTCPQFPGAAAMFAASSPALTANAANIPVEIERTHATECGPVEVSSSPSHAHAGRGPPEATLI